MEKAFVVGEVYCSDYPYNQEGYPVAVFTDKNDAEKFVEKRHYQLKSDGETNKYYAITEATLNPKF